MPKGVIEKFSIEARWVFTDEAGQQLNANMFELLKAIDSVGKLTAAAQHCGMSYRHAWNQLQQWESFFGVALVHLQKGRGARLSSFGEKLLWAQKRIDAKLEPELENISSEINLHIQALNPDSSEPLTINASHGYAVALLTEHIQSPSLKLTFTSAEDALRSLSAGECDLAGFHVPEKDSDLKRIPAFDRYLNNQEFGLIRFIQRRQGLMVTSDNPLGIRQICDLARDNIRFVNRQQSSGTRFLFDQFLERADIKAEQINGYTGEEFTHSAVAAHIAAGMADVGFGVEQAARQFGLEFLPLCKEQYLFAYHKERLASQRLASFIGQLQSVEIQQAIQALSGYQPSRCGELAECSEL
ncbi:substrate-binding domain-containing protein [Pseudoteredinibacter isoporae]|uniref:Molybdate transport repressor ModE-like protein n=1 Tax=Pseudoteredinibacter isoporae TaxID=570281 RepID=A0A7X0JQZ1_9GAMM|nr:substrate-binding domain-containing protein [Pseudoteredinibacter isoporae]MBB6520043.1 molybdate transport repressor ModE-like protein [Pseudoteredinibacter isoporae]NHO85615.1 helix-turn-helix transcriptional regulator [Pseudoteredinibacter isoporae]NIB25933.1 helix-turn-helix transcriptional regulator [Pseudoteredinibacter isoporae]